MSGVGASPAPEIRLDHLTGMRVILAPARAERPIDFEAASHGPVSGRDCPFCEGAESETPPELWADRDGDGDGDVGTENGGGWSVRSIPNLFPALEGAGPPTPTATSSRSLGPEGLFEQVPGSGSHEVIVQSPNHLRSLSELGDGQLTRVVAGWRERFRSHPEARCVQLIVNEGPDAGASLEHTHAQLYAMDFVPPLIARERERFGAYREETGGGELLADVVAEEIRRGERVVAVDDEAVLVCPWASRSPYELRIVPREVVGDFAATSMDGRGVSMLSTALEALTARFGSSPQLNLWVRTAPRGAEPFHWHMDIAPRTSIRAGFENATGVEINIMPPERAADELREALGPS